MWTHRPVILQHVSTCCDAIWDVIFTSRTEEFALWEKKFAEWARGGGLFCLGCIRSPDHCLNLLFVFGIYLVAVLGPHQRGCKAEGRVLQASPVTLDDSGRQDGHDV